MPDLIPPYLKLHTVDHDQQVESNLPGFFEISTAFESITGWTLAYHETEASHRARQSAHDRSQPISGRLAVDDLSEKTTRRQQRGDAEELVEAFNHVVCELDRQREHNWKLNAELATAIPVVHRNDGTLAKLLNSLLLTAADALNCSQAALYILDDATAYLTQRCAVGFDAVDMLQEPRQLSSAKADLEALIGHAVTVKDAEQLQHWNVPQRCRSAVCIPVSSSTTPLGTLWVFSPETRDFSADETNILEIVAGRIAAELEKEAVLRQIQSGGENGIDLGQLREFLAARIPNVKPPIDEIDIDARIVDAESNIGSFYDWTICQDGRIAFCCGRGAGKPLRAVGVATILQTAFRAHCGDAISAERLFDQIFETTQAVGPGEYPATLMCGMIDPTNGTCEIAALDFESLVLIDRYGRTVQRLVPNTPFSGEYGVASCFQFELGERQTLFVADERAARYEGTSQAIGDFVAQAGFRFTGKQLLDSVNDLEMETPHSESLAHLQMAITRN